MTSKLPPSIPFRLNHVHLSGLTPYITSSNLQKKAVKQHLTHVARQDASRHYYDPAHVPPPPFLVTFQMKPTYTIGRREASTISPRRRRYLAEGTVELGPAEFMEAKRGGQTTFHGPGQLVGYLVCNLKRHGLDVRGYVTLLEESVLDVCRELGLGERGLGVRDDAPGVWVGIVPEGVAEGNDGGIGEARDEVAGSEETASKAEGLERAEFLKAKKLASVGVHLRRYVSSHGIALNVCTNLGWFKRIQACGMPGDLMTNMLEQDLQWEDRWTARAMRRISEGSKGRIAQVGLEYAMGDISTRLARAVERRLLGFDPGPILEKEARNTGRGETKSIKSKRRRRRRVQR